MASVKERGRKDGGTETFLWAVHFNTPLQQRLDPAGDALAVAIKECEYVTRSIGGTNEARTDQTFTFVGADEPHAVQFTDVVGKLGLQVAYFFFLFWNTNTHGYNM